MRKDDRLLREKKLRSKKLRHTLLVTSFLSISFLIFYAFLISNLIQRQKNHNQTSINFRLKIKPNLKQESKLFFETKKTKKIKKVSKQIKKAKPKIEKKKPSKNRKLVAITFDDGPGKHTKKLLSILKQYKAKATFFLLGIEAQKYPELIKMIYNQGHEIGNHSYSHKNFATINKKEIIAQIRVTNDIIKSAVPKAKITSFRPPYGSYNKQILKIIEQEKLANILWSVDIKDWQNRFNKNICDQTITNTKPGAIILMHDIYQTSVEAVPCIMEKLVKQGYDFVTISELFNNQLKVGYSYYSTDFQKP